MAELPLAVRAAAEIEYRRRAARRLGVEALQGVIILPAWGPSPTPPESIEEAKSVKSQKAAERRTAARAQLAELLLDRKHERKPRATK